MFSKLSTSVPGPRQALVQWHREAERSPSSSADVRLCEGVLLLALMP